LYKCDGRPRLTVRGRLSLHRLTNNMVMRAQMGQNMSA